jgi:hypothetical protein
MASGTGWKWALGALIAAGVGLNGACSDDDTGGGGGGGTATPLLWNSTSGGPNGTAGAGGSTPLNWIDPNTPVNTGGGGVIASQDERTYGTPTQYLPTGDLRLGHALMTNTSNGQITNPEDLLASFINAYRQQVLGAGAGGIIGGIPIGGGFQNVLLPMDINLRKNARAHCKHTAINHAGPLVIDNNEGDDPWADAVMDGALDTPAGRLPKSKISDQGGYAAVTSGAAYFDAQTASVYFINLNAAQISNQNYTAMGCGYWTGFSEQYYWHIILARNPALVP